MIDKVMTNWIEVLMKSIMTDNGGGVGGGGVSSAAMRLEKLHQC